MPPHPQNGLHFDGGDFFSLQIDGTKEWHLVDPLHAVRLYADFVYPPPGPSYGLQVFRRKGVDVARLPGILDTPTHTVSVRPGDVLYIPQRWWHEIRSKPGRNIGVVLQTQFPPPRAVAETAGADAGPWTPSFYSHDLLRFARAWRRDGLAGMPASLAKVCGDHAGTSTEWTSAEAEAAGLRRWEAAMNATVRRQQNDNSRSDRSGA